MKKSLIYVTDLDRTMIYSKRFIDEQSKENGDVGEYHCIETKGGTEISYMADKVRAGLRELAKTATVIPVTTRSLEEYQRVDLGFTPKYALVANGGILLRDGKVDENWSAMMKSKINYPQALNMIRALEDTEVLDREVKVIDGVYLFTKTLKHEEFDRLANEIDFEHEFNGWQVTRQGNKIYATPQDITKQVAVRVLWHKLNKPYIVASGDGLLDLGMLTIADRAIIPSHSELISKGYVEECEQAFGGINSPLYTMGIVENELKEHGEPVEWQGW